MADSSGVSPCLSGAWGGEGGRGKRRVKGDWKKWECYKSAFPFHSLWRRSPWGLRPTSLRHRSQSASSFIIITGNNLSLLLSSYHLMNDPRGTPAPLQHIQVIYSISPHSAAQYADAGWENLFSEWRADKGTDKQQDVVTAHEGTERGAQPTGSRNPFIVQRYNFSF